MHTEWRQNNWDIARYCSGTFCAAHVLDKENSDVCLALTSDKLGIRPIYYWKNSHLIVFATALRILEAISFIPKDLNIQGITEIVAFGFPLADRTAYSGIRTIREGETCIIDQYGEKTVKYWKWNATTKQTFSSEQELQTAYQNFKNAVLFRLKNDDAAWSFLSGGMDSRAIVSLLRSLNVDVHTISASISGSQDEEFAQQFGLKASCKMVKKDIQYFSDQGFRLDLAFLTSEVVSHSPANIQHPNVIWSGDGGSVSVGTVYMDDIILEMLKANQRDKSIAYYLSKNGNGVPLKLLRKKNRNNLIDILTLGINEELSRLDGSDEAAKFHLFLMLNDQRRHLADFFEEEDMHGLEYQLPFFDAIFLEQIFSLPIEYRLNHRFYTEWFSIFPDIVREVPWQTYPGHVLCPVQHNYAKLKYQWSKTQPLYEKTYWSNRVLPAFYGLKNLIYRSQGWNIISRFSLTLAAIAHILGIGNYNYLLKAANIYVHYGRDRVK